MEKNIEFEEMKQQLQQLQQRIDNQVEINERQTRRAIEEGVGKMRKKDEQKYRLCLYIAFLIPILLLTQGLPTIFCVSTLSLLLANAGWRKYLNNCYEKLDGLSLVETSKTLLKYKKDERISLLLGLPLAFFWIAWYIMNLNDLPLFSRIDFRFSYAGIAVGAILSLVIGLTKFYLPQQRAADRLLRQIEEVQGEK